MASVDQKLSINIDVDQCLRSMMLTDIFNPLRNYKDRPTPFIVDLPRGGLSLVTQDFDMPGVSWPQRLKMFA